MRVKEDIHIYLYGTKDLDLLLYKLRYDPSGVLRYLIIVGYRDIGYLIPMEPDHILML